MSWWRIFQTLSTVFACCFPRLPFRATRSNWIGNGRSMAAIGTFRPNTKWRGGRARRFSNTSTRRRRKFTSRRNRRSEGPGRCQIDYEDDDDEDDWERLSAKGHSKKLKESY